MNVEFKILEHIFSFGENIGWTKELNVVAWGSRPAKYDIRSWNEDHTKMTKGITFSREELIQLRDALEKEKLESGSSYVW